MTFLHSPRNDLARSDGLPSLVKSGELAGSGAGAWHMRELRATSDEDAAFETDVLAGFVLARASAGLAEA